MYIDTSKETSLPDKNQYNSIKAPKKPKQFSWKTVSEFKEIINKLRNEYLNTKKEDCKDETDYEGKRGKLNHTNCWEEDLTTYGYARCLRSRCNFISNNIRVIKCHYRDCDGVPRFKGQHFCPTCQNYLSSTEAHAAHVPICKGFNKYNQKDYKYEKGLRARKSVSKVPLDRLLSWQDQIINHGSACCGYKMCTFVSVSLSDLEEHYVTCCGVSGVKSRCCAHCSFRFFTEDEYAQHRSRCLGNNRLYQTSVEENYGYKPIENLKENTEKKQKQIVQPKPEVVPGVCRQQRPCTQRHIRSWKLTLSKEKCVRCSFPNCNFIAMSLEDMIRHFSYCNADKNFAKVVCPYCRGRVTSEDVLKEHIERSHWNNNGVASKRSQKNTNLVSKMFSARVLTNDHTERLRAWQMQIVKFGYAYCMELNCNFMAKTLKELDVHVLTCRETAKKKFTMCRKCKIKLPTEQLVEHKSKCHETEDNRKGWNERRKLWSESGPGERERKDCKTYSRKRKVDLDLNNEDSGNLESHTWNNGTEMKSQDEMEGCEESEDNEIQVIEEENEEVETGRTVDELDGGEVEFLQPETEPTVVEIEYESDKSEIEIIEERIEKLEMSESSEKRSNSNGIEILGVEQDEEQKKSESDDEMVEDEEVEKVETVDIVEDELEGLESEDEGTEKIETVEIAEGEREKLECEDEMLEVEKPKKVEVDERETEEIVKGETVGSKQPAEVKHTQDTPESGMVNHSENGKKKESKKTCKGGKDDRSEKDVDRFGLDESEEEEDDHRMEIDEGVMTTIFETLDDDFDKLNPPYSIIGNEIEVFEGNENSQGTVIVLPNEDSQSFLINEDTGTLDRSEPASTDSEQLSDKEGAEDNEEVQDSGQGDSGQGMEDSGGQNSDNSSDETNDSDSGKESDNGRDGGKEKDDNDGDGDGKRSGNRKKVEKGEDSDNADESEEKDNDEDEKKRDSKTKETSKKGGKVEKDEGSSKGRSGEKYEDNKSDVGESKDSINREKPKEGRMTRRSGRNEDSKESEKDKAKRGARKSKRWSEEDGGEEYIPKRLSWEGEDSEDEGGSVAKSRGRRRKSRNEVKSNVIESQVKKTVEEVKCGKCEYKCTRAKFDQHNWTKHFGLGWIEGEKEVDLNDYEEVTRLVRTAFKVTKRGVCEVCKEVKRSYLGFASHIQKCGKSPTEMDALKVKCPHCSTKCLKYSLKSHIYVFHGKKDSDKAKGKNKDEDKDTDVEGNLNASTEGDVSKDKEKVKTDENEMKDGGEPGPQEHVVSSSKRKSALRAVSKFQEAFKDNAELVEEEKAREPGYFFYEKGGKLPKLCYKLCNVWYALRRKKKMIPCRHKNCSVESSDVKEAKLHHYSCSSLPSEVYFCEVCDFYSVDESEIQSHVKTSHKRSKKRRRESKEDADMDFGDNEDVDAEDSDEEEEDDEEEAEESENDFEECDSVYERQKKRNNNKKKVEEEEKKAVRKRTESESEEDTTELVHKQNFCEREKLENLRGDEFYSNALEMTREFEEGYKGEGESSQEEDDDEDEEGEEEAVEEEEEDSEIDHSRVWPELHTESEDWCRVTREVSSVHLPEVLESISVSFMKGDKKEYNWKRFKRFEGQIIEDVPAMFVGGSVRSMSWCKVSFRRTLEKSVKQYLAVSTAKNIDHLTDIHKNRRPFSWSLVQIWDCGALENSRAIEPPKFCLGIFQEGGEIWDMLWFPEDTYGKGSNGKLTRIGILATASDDGAVRIWSICDPSQIIVNSKLPLFITEPLVKLIIDNFLEDSCVRLSIGRDGIVAGGYVNGSLAVWNLKNMSSPFCEKIGKCVVIKPHLIIQAHRTSITALTFCPNDNRYITSGGLDRVVKLWDLESPWVPVEQYQREMCLDNIWPKNWPMNIYNFEDVYPNNRKGVIRFVKDVITSKHSPCLILDNTCLNLSFSDWLNAICGCSNTGEVKIRFLKNFFRDQDKKQEKNQSTLSSLRVEKLKSEDDSDWESSASKDGGGDPKTLPKSYGVLNAQYGIVIKDHSVKDKGKPLTDAFHPEDFPIRAINKVCFNPNFKSFTHIAVGYNCGLIRIQRLNELQFNNAIKSFSENAKKPRL